MTRCFLCDTGRAAEVPDSLRCPAEAYGVVGRRVVHCTWLQDCGDERQAPRLTSRAGFLVGSLTLAVWHKGGRGVVLAADCRRAGPCGAGARSGKDAWLHPGQRFREFRSGSGCDSDGLACRHRADAYRCQRRGRPLPVFGPRGGTLCRHGRCRQLADKHGHRGGERRRGHGRRSAGGKPQGSRGSRCRRRVDLAGGRHPLGDDPDRDRGRHRAVADHEGSERGRADGAGRGLRGHGGRYGPATRAIRYRLRLRIARWRLRCREHLLHQRHERDELPQRARRQHGSVRVLRSVPAQDGRLRHRVQTRDGGRHQLRHETGNERVAVHGRWILRARLAGR